MLKDREKRLHQRAQSMSDTPKTAGDVFEESLKSED